RRTVGGASAAPATELVLDAGRVEAARGEQHVAVEPEVGELFDEPLVRLGRAGERRLDALLAQLARRGSGAGVEERDDVRSGWPLGAPLEDTAPQPRREARLRAGVARRPGRTDAQQDRVPVAVLADLLDRERVARGRALVP